MQSYLPPPAQAQAQPAQAQAQAQAQPPLRPLPPLRVELPTEGGGGGLVTLVTLLVNVLRSPSTREARPIEGFEGTGSAFSPPLDTTVITGATPGNDVVVIRTVSTTILPFVTPSAYAGGRAAIRSRPPS